MASFKKFFAAFSGKFPLAQRQKAFALLIIQLAITALLLGTIVLVAALRASTYTFYLILVGSLALINFAALGFNLNGRYTPAALLTLASLVVGPWLSLLFDMQVAGGDFVPIIYITLSIQLCAILLSAKATGIIAALQLAGLAAFVVLNPALSQLNWPSLAAFVVFAAALGSITSYINRTQVSQIEQQRNQLQDSEEKLRELSQRDSLTGLYNRRSMEAILEQEVELARLTQQSLGIIMADVDGFKAINDNYGHALGDQLLVHIAQVLTKSVRRGDSVCRYGGDEFVLVLRGCLPQCCREKANQLRHAISATKCECEHVDIGTVSISVGIAMLPEDGTTVKALLKVADDAMYEEKIRKKGLLFKTNADEKQDDHD